MRTAIGLAVGSFISPPPGPFPQVVWAPSIDVTPALRRIRVGRAGLRRHAPGLDDPGVADGNLLPPCECALPPPRGCVSTRWGA